MMFINGSRSSTIGSKQGNPNSSDIDTTNEDKQMKVEKIEPKQTEEYNISGFNDRVTEKSELTIINDTSSLLSLISINQSSSITYSEIMIYI